MAPAAHRLPSPSPPQTFLRYDVTAPRSTCLQTTPRDGRSSAPCRTVQAPRVRWYSAAPRVRRPSAPCQMVQRSAPCQTAQRPVSDGSAPRVGRPSAPCQTVQRPVSDGPAPRCRTVQRPVSDGPAPRVLLRPPHTPPCCRTSEPAVFRKGSFIRQLRLGSTCFL